MILFVSQNRGNLRLFFLGVAEVLVGHAIVFTGVYCLFYDHHASSLPRPNVIAACGPYRLLL